MSDVGKEKGQMMNELVELRQRIVELEALEAERKQAEEALRESERRYRLLAENAKDAIWTVDMNMRPTYMSPSITYLLGYTVEEAMANPMEAVYTPASFEIAMKVLAEELAIENMEQKDLSRSRMVELELNRKDGSIVPVEGNFSFIRGADGRPVGILAIARDITERKQVEEEAKEARDEYLTVTNLTGDIIVRVDIEGRWTFLNDGACQFWGKPREELIGKAFADFLHPHDQEETAAAIQRAQSGEIVRGLINRQLTPDGWRTVEWNGAGIFNREGRFVGFQATGRDITERKQAEELFRGLAVSSPVGVYIVQNGKFQYVNPAFQKDTGYSEDELLGTDSLGIVVPEDREMVRENAVKMLKGQRLQPYEHRTINKAGETRWVLETVAPIEYNGKRATIGTYVDITERKQAEERVQELLESEKELHHNLEEEMKRRVEFTRALVHELKTPLTPILAASELLVEELQEEPLLSVAQNIQRSASTLNTRIDALLDLARGELGVLELKFGQVDPLQLLHRVAVDMSSVAARYELSLVLDVPSSLPPVWADESRLEQAVLNLLTNGFKWTPQGGKVTLRAREKDETLIVEVQDTGPGIAKENQQKIFDAYFRVENDRQRLDGLGLGLALCKTIVESHGGKIWVESEEGRGSTFGFSVPLHTDVG